MVGTPGGDPNFRPQEGGRWMMPRGERWMRSPAAEMLRIKLSHYRCRKDTAVQLVEWVVISFGVRRVCIFLKGKVPKVRAKTSTGTLLPILGAPVTIVSDIEIETIDLVLQNVQVEFGHGNGQVFVIPVDHDSFLPFSQPIETDRE